jgi:hypothetical protein
MGGVLGALAKDAPIGMLSTGAAEIAGGLFHPGEGAGMLAQANQAGAQGAGFFGVQAPLARLARDPKVSIPDLVQELASGLGEGYSTGALLGGGGLIGEHALGSVGSMFDRAPLPAPKLPSGSGPAGGGTPGPHWSRSTSGALPTSGRGRSRSLRRKGVLCVRGARHALRALGAPSVAKPDNAVVNVR